MLVGFLLTIGAATLGIVVTWLIIRTRTTVLSERLAGREVELHKAQQTQDRLFSENKDLQNELRTEASLRSTSEGRFTHVKAENDRLKAQVETLQERIVDLSSELSESEVKREEETKNLDEKLALLSEAREEFALQFKNLANDVLEDKSKRFTEQNKVNLDLLLTPLRSQIELFRQKVEETYDKESQQRASLRDAVENLSHLNKKMNDDAVNLTNALRGQSKTLGNWGEFILEEILQKAGLVEDREYAIRETLIAPDGKRSQPDVIITLPENRHLIIDSKINLSAYLKHTSSENEAEAEAALRDHISAMRVHLREMDRRAYQDHYKLNSLDFVLMFVPLEPAFIVAVRRDPTLFDDAFAKRIVIVCPSTLLATMRTVRNIWQQEQQKRNVLEIARQSGALYDKFVGFVEDLSDIGAKLQQAQSSYDAAHNKLTSGKGNLVSRAERIRDLGAKASKRLPLHAVEASSTTETVLTSTEPQDLEELAVPLPGFENSGLFPDSVGDDEKGDDVEDLTLIKSQKVSAAGTSEPN
jgi:DNA recombination protein RmuC